MRTLAKRKQQAESRAPESSASSHRVAVLIAAISTLGVLGAAAITGAVTLLDEDDRPSAKGSAVPGNTSGIQLESMGFKSVAPPPKVRYTFDGTTTIQLDDEDAVFVLRKLASDRWAISPAATFRPDGSWHVDWTLAKSPAPSAFHAVVAKRVRIHLPGAPATGGTGYRYWQDRLSVLEKLGVAAPSVDASDQAEELSEGE